MHARTPDGEVRFQRVDLVFSPVPILPSVALNGKKTCSWIETDLDCQFGGNLLKFVKQPNSEDHAGISFIPTFRLVSAVFLPLLPEIKKARSSLLILNVPRRSLRGKSNTCQADVTMAARPFYLPVRGPAAQPGCGMKVPGLCVGSLARVHTMARTRVLFGERRASS